LDWAGDSGFKFTLGSSLHLILCWVSSEDYGGLHHGLCDLRERQGLPRTFEFHFARNSDTVRAAFFANLPALPWEAATLIVNKQTLPREFRRMREPVFYGHFLGYLLALAPLPILTVKRLLVDESQRRSELLLGIRAAMSPVLRARGLERPPRVSGQPSREWDGLQVADMLAGAVAESESGERGYLQHLDRLCVYHYELDK